MVEERESISLSEHEHKRKPLWWHEQGLSQTASGYGDKLVTELMVKYNNRWYRVYCMCYSNIGTCYIVTKGRMIIVTD